MVTSFLKRHEEGLKYRLRHQFVNKDKKQTSKNTSSTLTIEGTSPCRTNHSSAFRAGTEDEPDSLFSKITITV
jgi:hypothetical protein